METLRGWARFGAMVEVVVKRRAAKEQQMRKEASAFGGGARRRVCFLGLADERSVGTQRV